jgi:hypothetical protein
MSEIADKVYGILKKVFTRNVIIKEHYVNYKNTKLFFDFFIKDLEILIECQGQQHTRFVKHFHEDKDGYLKSKKRDNIKVEYAQEKNIAFVRFYYDENVTKKLVMNRIYKAI